MQHHTAHKPRDASTMYAQKDAKLNDQQRLRWQEAFRGSIAGAHIRGSYLTFLVAATTSSTTVHRYLYHIPHCLVASLA